jgi:hypothetical protein
MPFQLIGKTKKGYAEIGSDGSIRITNRPPDFGSLGLYAIEGLSGSMAAGLGANSPIFSTRWTNATKKALIQRVFMAMSSLGTAFAAGVGKFDLFFARSFSASDSGGTSILPTGDKNKKRTSMGTTLFGDMRIASTGTLTAGTRTLDTNPLRRLMFAVGTATNTVYLATALLAGMWLDGDHPYVLAQNEGLIIQATVPATGVWQFSVGLEWAEVIDY